MVYNDVLTRQGRRGYDTTADIYSVGITVLELLNGAPPYQGLPPTKVHIIDPFWNDYVATFCNKPCWAVGTLLCP